MSKVDRVAFNGQDRDERGSIGEERQRSPDRSSKNALLIRLPVRGGMGVSDHSFRRRSATNACSVAFCNAVSTARFTAPCFDRPCSRARRATNSAVSSSLMYSGIGLILDIPIGYSV